jgi:hypothetical protein
VLFGSDRGGWVAVRVEGEGASNCAKERTVVTGKKVPFRFFNLGQAPVHGSLTFMLPGSSVRPPGRALDALHRAISPRPEGK